MNEGSPKRHEGQPLTRESFLYPTRPGLTPVERMNIAFLSSLIFHVMALTLLTAITVAVAGLFFEMPYEFAPVPIGILIIGQGVAVVLARSGRLFWGVLTFAGLAIGIITWYVVADIAQTGIFILAFLVVPILIVSFFLSLRATLAVGGVCVLLLLVTPWLSGSVTYVNLIAMPLPFALFVYTLIFVITDHRNRMERYRQGQLVESDLRYRALLESTHEGMVLLQDGVILDANEGLHRMLGYSGNELQGESFAALLNDEDEDPHTVTHTQQVSAMDSIHLKRRDGTTFLAEIIANTIKLEGKTLLAMAVRDVTERRQMEEALRQSQKMESIGTLAGGVAHDFNNILASIMGYVELIKRQVPEEGQLFDDVDGIGVATERARDLVRQILTFSRRTEPARKTLEFRDAVSETLDLVRKMTPPMVEIHGRSALSPGLIKADPTQIHQVVMNLCANAIDAMHPGGGVLRLALEQLPSEGTAPAMMQLTIEDSGPGIPAEIRDRIFEPFYTTKSPGKGTGLGLSVVHGIVAAHSGTLQIDCPPGGGTVVRVRIPTATESAEPDAGTDAQTGAVRARVLLVDDDPILLKVTRRMLAGVGCEVEAFLDPQEAIQAWDEDPSRFDLLFTDYAMPSMTGLDLMEEARKTRPDLPAVLCTGLADWPSSDQMEGSSRFLFLLKPYDREQLSGALESLLGDADPNER